MEIGGAMLVGVLDRIGMVAFAFSGVELGARRRLDLFGLVVMGVVSATGGGFMRDVALGHLPALLGRPDYLLWAVGSSLLSIALVWRGRKIPGTLLVLADAAGLGVFAAAGALAAIRADLSVPAVILLAMVTAVGGGVIRDLLADRVPLVLRSEVNATAAAIGGFVVWAIEPWSAGIAVAVGAAFAAAIRLATVKFDLHLPVPGPSDEDSSAAG